MTEDEKSELVIATMDVASVIRQVYLKSGLLITKKESLNQALVLMFRSQREDPGLDPFSLITQDPG